MLGGLGMRPSPALLLMALPLERQNPGPHSSPCSAGAQLPGLQEPQQLERGLPEAGGIFPAWKDGGHHGRRPVLWP